MKRSDPNSAIYNTQYILKKGMDRWWKPNQLKNEDDGSRPRNGDSHFFVSFKINLIRGLALLTSILITFLVELDLDHILADPSCCSVFESL